MARRGRRGQTAAQRAASIANLKKAREARSRNARVRRISRAATTRRIYSSDIQKRGVGTKGAKKNFVPYLRINQRSQTGGYNVGTAIPNTGKRIVTGAYIRLENIKRGGVITSAIRRASPPGTLRGKARRYFNENVTISNPALRANVGRAEARLTTGRTGSGPTITIRKGKHKVPQKLSKAGIKEYDLRMKKIRKDQKKPRRQRRRR